MTQPPNTTFSAGWAAWTRHFLEHQMAPMMRHIRPSLPDRRALWVEIGSYEGRSACWVLQQMLTGPDAHMICIDPWDRAAGHGAVFMRFLGNLRAIGAQHSVSTMSMSSREVTHSMLRSLDAIQRRPGGDIDVAYIDGDHHARSALLDGALLWPLIRSGGHIVFDDYPLNKGPANHPAPGIDAFLQLWADELVVVHQGWNVIARKK